MSWLLIAGGVAIVSGLLSWAIIRRFGRTSVLLWLAVPAALWLVTFVVAFEVAARFATCNSPDCGPLLFVAGLLFAGALSTGGLLGSIVGVWRAARTINRG